MELDDRTQRALFRLQVISPLISGPLSKQEAARVRREILERTYTTPDGTHWQISRRTLRYWLQRYEKNGFEGLHDADRGTYGTCRAIASDILTAAEELRKQESRLSVKQIMDLLPCVEALKGREADLERVTESTLNRQLTRRGARKGRTQQEDGCFQRWQQKFVNAMWQGDCCDGVWLPDPFNPGNRRKTYLISFIDDASRVVPHAQFYWDMQLPSLLDCFKKALLKRGKPDRIYCDNAWIYHSTTMTLLCAQLDIRSSFSKKKRPPGRGKVERHIRTVQEGFMKIAEHAGIKTLDELNQFFFAWLTNKYHKSEHSELDGLSPMERWRIDKESLTRVSPAEVRRGLMLRCQRRVDRKTSEVRLNKVKYQASIALSGEKVEVRYHFDDQSEIELWQRGKLLEIAKPVKVQVDIDFTRHPKKDSEEPKRGVTYPAFKAYRDNLVGGKDPEQSIVPQRDYLTEQGLLDLFADCLQRELSAGEEEFLRRFFHRHAPLVAKPTRTLLGKVVEAAGNRQHLRTYCERLIESIIYGGKR